MDNKNHFESNVSDFLGALRKVGYSEATIRKYKKTCRLFGRLYGYKRHTGL